jgi:hypothetical protein
MSGVEVIGAISAVIGILDASVKIYNSAQKDLKLSETFEAVGNRLPILLDTLQTCESHRPTDSKLSSGERLRSLEKDLGRMRQMSGNIEEYL